jgi:hypothetical protein
LMTAKEFLAGYPIAAGDVMLAARP